MNNISYTKDKKLKNSLKGRSVDAAIDVVAIINIYPRKENVHFIFERGDFRCQKTEVAVVAVSDLVEIAAG